MNCGACNLTKFPIILKFTVAISQFIKILLHNCSTNVSQFICVRQNFFSCKPDGHLAKRLKFGKMLGQIDDFMDANPNYEEYLKL